MLFIRVKCDRLDAQLGLINGVEEESRETSVEIPVSLVNWHKMLSVYPGANV